jgi:VIT1/CCC1 family predicted Fe2+/Mn2+ transporter
MADMEAKHARLMERGLREMGVRIPRYRVSTQTRLLKTLARLFGPRAIYPLLHGIEMTGSTDYATQDAATASLAPEERSHARVLGQMGQPAFHPERWHRRGGGGSLRAAVFGVSDGLISNLSLVMGFAGASADNRLILLAGLSGLLAGAFSMAAGEYVSMRAQTDLFERQIALEKAELDVLPAEEKEELSMLYQAKGFRKSEADDLANRLLDDPGVALDSLIREELGLDPGTLGSPIQAAASSLLSFAVGAALPVIPFLFGGGTALIALSIALSAAALFGVGAFLSIFTGKGFFMSGLRQLAIGAVAAAVTFAVGIAIGVSAG